MKKPKMLKVVRPKPSEGWACIHCGRSFPSMEAMMKHVSEAHEGGGMENEEEQEEVINNSDHLVPVEKETIKNPSSPPESRKTPQEEMPKIEPIKQVPIELGYKYTGTCPQCHGDIETLMIDIEVSKKQKQFAIAFCNNCKKKLKSREVVKL